MSDEKTKAEPSGASGGSLANAHSARQDAEAKIIVDGIAEIMRIASEPDWIPVTERLPDDGRKVLAFDEHFPVVQSARRDGSRWDCEGLDFLKPTHWMPLPAPPTDAK